MLEVAEACIDIAGHIIAAEGFNRPSDYADIFEPLAENGILEEDLAERLGEMAKFRNFLVHRYDKVDLERLQEFRDDDIGDVKQFLDSIYTYIERENS